MENKINTQHLNRKAVIYIRQSTMGQVFFNTESTERQYALKEKAMTLGWPEELIQIVDDDLGISGAQKTNRMGFQNMVADVSMGKVGGIFGLEISRLARSSADLLKLLELCALFDTIVVDEDGIYNLSDFNDRLVLGFKGTMSEVELHLLRSRLVGGKSNKAKKGELRFPLPVGYVYDEQDQITFDPNEEIQHAVHRLFSLFSKTGSAYGVIKVFSQNNFPFPKRSYGGVWNGEVIWGKLTHNRVLSILKNPSYAGVYVYGRYKSIKKLNSDGNFITSSVKQSQSNWDVFIQDHHPGYITWEQYEKNLKQLDNNCTNKELSGPAREGKALLQGIILCGQCGNKMTVHYSGNGGISPRYECRHRYIDGMKSICSSLPVAVVDNVVVDKFLDLIKPAHLEISLKALDEAFENENEGDRQWKLAIERAQYEADRVKRQYEQVEPENRLVARSLESRWNEKLSILDNLQEEYELYCKEKTWHPNANERQKILNLAQKLPQIWLDETTSSKDRKRILRILIQDVTVKCEARKKDVMVGIRFRNGSIEEVITSKSLPYSSVRKHTKETVNKIRELAKEMNDEEIATYLNNSGHRTPEKKLFTKGGVRWIRMKYKILFQLVEENSLTVKETADYFGVSNHVVYYWINNSIIKATKKRNGSPWNITIDQESEKRLQEWVQHSSRINPKSD